MAIIKASEIQELCPLAANLSTKKFIHDRQWEKAIKAIDDQIFTLEQRIEVLVNFQDFLKQIKR